MARLVPVGQRGALRAALAGDGIRWTGRRPTMPEPVVLRGDGPSAAETVIADRGPR